MADADRGMEGGAGGQWWMLVQVRGPEEEGREEGSLPFVLLLHPTALLIP